MNKEEKNGVSLFTQSDFLINEDPLEEIFALNLGDFIAENLISEDLAKKIGKSEIEKKEGIKKQLKELVSIYSLNNTLCVLTFNSKEEQAIYTSIAKSIAQMVEVEACHIYLSYEFTKSENEENDIILAGSSSGNSPLALNYDDDNAISKAFSEREIRKENGILAIPMYSNIQVVGIIALEYKKEVQEEFVSLVESIGNLFGTSIALQKSIDCANILFEDENTHTEDFQHSRAELTALIGDLCDFQQIFVENLANAVDAKGQYKVSHSKNTAELARKICKELKLNEKTTDLIYYAGLLQNIGKIAIPEKMFATNGKLTPEDLKKIQEHSNLGVHLLMNINFLSEVVPYITYQKERVDGSGTPEGLKGQSIPLGSRIIAAADAYSAMTSDRPYRKAMEKSEALNIMKSEAGKKWDEVVVQALENSIA